MSFYFTYQLSEHVSNYLTLGLKSQKSRKMVKTMVKRGTQLQFFYDLLAPVCMENENMFLARVGRGERSELKLFKIHLVHLGGDGEFEDSVCGCQAGRLFRNCRLCLDTATSRLIFTENNFIYRDDREHQELVKYAEEIELRQLLHNMKVTTHKITVEEKNALTKMRNYCLTAGANPLYRLFSEFNSKGILGLHKAAHPDRFRVVFKGIVEKTIAWTLSIISNMRYFLKEYSNSMEILDNRVISFPYVQAYEFCRYVILNESFITSG
jgi:hypothetical protein